MQSPNGLQAFAPGLNKRLADDAGRSINLIYSSIPSTRRSRLWPPAPASAPSRSCSLSSVHPCWPWSYRDCYPDSSTVP